MNAPNPASSYNFRNSAQYCGGTSQAYFNIHTTQFPGGEIRGQLQPVPEPATLLLLTSGIVGVIGAVRKRRDRA